MEKTIVNAGNLSPEEKARAVKIGEDAAEAVVKSGEAVVETGKQGAKVVSDAATSAAKEVKDKGVVDAISQGATNIKDGALGFLGLSGDPEKDKKGLNVGSLMGGFLGAGGAWAISKLLGGGILSTVAMIAMIPMGIIIGTQFGDKNLNPLIGREPHGKAPTKAQEQASALAAQPQVAQNPNVTTGLGPNNGELYQQFRGDIRSQYPNFTSSDVVGIGTVVQPYVPGRTTATAQGQPYQPLGWYIGG